MHATSPRRSESLQSPRTRLLPFGSVYLPHVWWAGNTPVILALHGTVAPLIDNTINKMRANELFRWLRNQGRRFLAKLQPGVNQGALGLNIALRMEDGRCGPIAAGRVRTRRQAARQTQCQRRGQHAAAKPGEGQ